MYFSVELLDPVFGITMSGVAEIQHDWRSVLQAISIAGTSLDLLINLLLAVSWMENITSVAFFWMLTAASGS
ncbi:hypothetical protein A6X21_14910 [Planctopirus hydrillae]|uniref:Uncharacterized protein n=1 Tax=Planctopirus hydrillae TaxID=1841610 RepID=A0A1C3E4H4_9PLAN|nr:hypothetical protein A6X21_14910 [Planctopirus hydrillae]